MNWVYRQIGDKFLVGYFVVATGPEGLLHFEWWTVETYTTQHEARDAVNFLNGGCGTKGGY